MLEISTKITAVIPTRNRPDDLKEAVISILEQARPPEELIIVDQSIGNESKLIVESLFNKDSQIQLVYIHDPNITGLVDAKRVAVLKASGDIVCFLEDDVVLEHDYLKQIEIGFNEKEDMLGSSGVITNQPNQSFLFRIMHSFFFQGIFNDPRATIFVKSSDDEDNLVLCDVLCGGLSAWRREVLKSIPFDVDNGFFMLEDIEYSTRVVKQYGHLLYVNRMARLLHNASLVNRDPHGHRQRRKLTEGITFYKKRNHWPGAKRGLFLVLIWWFIEALIQCVKVRSIIPVRGYSKGIIDGVSKKVIY